MTTRHGGVSAEPYTSFNLGDHVGDKPALVNKNRDTIYHLLQLPSQPIWLEQVHGTAVLTLPCVSTGTSPIADACYTTQAGIVCTIMTADCLPVLLCNKQGTEVAAVHAGWRGLCDGVIEACLAKFISPKNEIMAYLGPAIGAEVFEVGTEVKLAFVDKHPQDACYFQATDDRFLADIQGLAKARLLRAGVNETYQANICTYSHIEDFFSYRREGVTGRMASFIWLDG